MPLVDDNLLWPKIIKKKKKKNEADEQLFEDKIVNATKSGELLSSPLS